FASDVHQVGLVVIDPVSDVGSAGLDEVIECMPALLQARRQPAFWTPSGRRRDALAGAEHDAALFLGRHEMEVARVALVVPHELPAELDCVLDDLGIIVAHLTVEGSGPAHSMTCHHLHQTKDADTVAVVARRPVDDIGCLTGPAGYWLVQREGLNVWDNPEGNASAVRPGDRGATVDWNIVNPSCYLLKSMGFCLTLRVK